MRIRVRHQQPLDIPHGTCYNVSMKKSKLTITDVLKAAIEESGVTRYRIAKETEIPETTLMRFMSGETTIRLDKADALAAYLGLRLVSDPKAVPPKPTPENLARPTLAKHNVRRRRSDRPKAGSSER